ncbi:phosphotransferase [Chelativorans sp. ZYF759]|uniref:phosphotransferase family protein n=1 Tax=Chelativorans sp. ZYF759 TaxID=2692213 RepID=UPI00145D468F|nr:phosphotransferase family protein [Chelativorans sp. ZYF759]NMG41662.1 phosphotransferase [Chelativorans sp. ZYF759]
MILEFSPDRLGEFLNEQFERATLHIERVGGGQSNPTFFVDHGSRRLVLRKKPAGEILLGAHAVDREFRVMKALEGTGVPVPRTVLFCDDDCVVGTPFYLMERLEGRVFHDASLAGVDPAQRAPIYFAMADVMARLHAVDPVEVGLGDFGRPGNYFERQIARWSRQYDESPSPRIPALDRVVGWLQENQPADDGRVAIAHGDFRLGNMLFHPTRPEVVAVLDWELSTLGHPLADLGFCCMPWRTSPDEYGGILGLDLPTLGLPDDRSFVEAYYRSAIPTNDLTVFHIAFALFRFAVIFVGIVDRARAGNAAAADAGRLAPLAERFAKRAEEAIQG